MAFSIVVLELRSDLLSCVRAADRGDPVDGACLLGLKALLWGRRINTTKNKLVIKDIIAGICHCGGPASACIDVDIHQAVGELRGVVVHDGYHLGGDFYWWAKYFSCGAINRCCSRVAIDDWVLI